MYAFTVRKVNCSSSLPFQKTSTYPVLKYSKTFSFSKTFSVTILLGYSTSTFSRARQCLMKRAHRAIAEIDGGIVRFVRNPGHRHSSTPNRTAMMTKTTTTTAESFCHVTTSAAWCGRGGSRRIKLGHWWYRKTPRGHNSNPKMTTGTKAILHNERIIAIS